MNGDWRVREHACSCPDAIPGVTRGRVNPACLEHGWEGDPRAEEGRSVVENDAIQAEFAEVLQRFSR